MNDTGKLKAIRMYLDELELYIPPKIECVAKVSSEEFDMVWVIKKRMKGGVFHEHAAVIGIDDDAESILVAAYEELYPRFTVLGWGIKTQEDVPVVAELSVPVKEQTQPIPIQMPPNPMPPLQGPLLQTPPPPNSTPLKKNAPMQAVTPLPPNAAKEDIGKYALPQQTIVRPNEKRNQQQIEADFRRAYTYVSNLYGANQKGAIDCVTAKLLEMGFQGREGEKLSTAFFRDATMDQALEFGRWGQTYALPVVETNEPDQPIVETNYSTLFYGQFQEVTKLLPKDKLFEVEKALKEQTRMWILEEGKTRPKINPAFATSKDIYDEAMSVLTAAQNDSASVFAN